MIQDDEVPQDDQQQTGESKDNLTQGVSSQEAPPSAPKPNSNYEERKRHKPGFVVRMWHIYRRNKRRSLRDISLEKATVFFTAVIAVCTGIQACIYWQQKGIMQSSGQQTDKIIQAANIQAGAAGRIADASDKNAAAADRFAGAADGINSQSRAAAEAMAEQVKKLQAGVSETHDLAIAAGKQADTSKTIAEKAIEQAQATNNLAAQTQRSAGISFNQLQVMQKQFETSERPWMSVVSSSVEHFDFLPSSSKIWLWGLNIQPRMIIKNVGNLPAVNVRLIGDIFLANWAKYTPTTEARERQKKLCSEGGSGVVAIGEPVTIVPSGTKEYNFVMRRDVDDEGEILRGMVTPVLVGCITYEYSASMTSHQTGFIFYVYGRYNGTGSNLLYGKPILASDMYLADAGDVTVTN